MWATIVPEIWRENMGLTQSQFGTNLNLSTSSLTSCRKSKLLTNDIIIESLSMNQRMTWEDHFTVSTDAQGTKSYVRSTKRSGISSEKKSLRRMKGEQREEKNSRKYLKKHLTLINSRTISSEDLELELGISPMNMKVSRKQREWISMRRDQLTTFLTMTLTTSFALPKLRSQYTTFACK